jgi:hypothetical protein
MANLYDKASFIFTANAYSASRLFSIKPTNGSGDLTFSRASACTRITPNGVIELLANNVPALNYSSSLSCPVLQLAPQRTNLVPTSNEFTTYLKDNSTIVGNILTENTANSTHRLETPFHSGYSTSSLYTYSAIIKQSVGIRDVIISVSNGTTGDMSSQALNLQNGTLSNSLASGTADWSNLSNRVTSLPNGYYLFELSGQTASGTTHRMRVGMVSGSTGNYLGNGTSSIEVSHFQSELGAFATSRIITTGASATRIADNLQSQNLGNLTNYTIFFDQLITYDTGSSSIQHIFNNTLGLFFYSVATNVGIRFYNQLNSQHMFGSNSGPINKWIITFNGSIYTLFVNGVKITTYTPPNTVNHVLTSFNTQISSGFLGQRDAAVGIKTISIFNNVLSDAECIALTT